MRVIPKDESIFKKCLEWNVDTLRQSMNQIGFFQQYGTLGRSNFLTDLIIL